MSSILRIGITAGDINGIGLEIILKSLARTGRTARHRAVIIGSRDAAERECRRLGVPVPPLWQPDASRNPPGPVSLWDPNGVPAPAYRPGEVRADAARAAHHWITAAARACMSGQLNGMVTAPICKEGFHRAGIDVPGHTELLAALTGTRRFEMMLFGGPLKVVLATRHIPIADVPAAITGRRVREAVRITDAGLAWMGLRTRRIAVCGLNPHAGEGGDIGTEDRRIIAPAVKQLRKEGIDARGPLPADTVFHHAAAGAYDAVVAMYHDQGLAPLKLIAFDSGVNLTLGLPIVRTSPDHGTAFDIAGRNLAKPDSMTEAITHCFKLAGRKNPWRHPTPD